MSNIFEISTEYLHILAEIEDIEGELTEELQEKLKINFDEELQEKLKINFDELQSKAEAYHHVIAITKGMISTIDEEIERLAAVKSVKENTIKRLKKYLLDATLLFGTESKSGNKVLEFPTLKLYTQNTESTVIDESQFTNFKFQLKETLTNEEILKITKLLERDIVTVPVVDKTEIKKSILASKDPLVHTFHPDITNKYKVSEIIGDVKGAKVIKTTGIRIR